MCKVFGLAEGSASMVMPEMPFAGRRYLYQTIVRIDTSANRRSNSQRLVNMHMQ